MRRRVRIRPRFWCVMIILTLAIFLAGRAVTRTTLERAEARYAVLNEQYRSLADEVSSLQNSIAFAQTDEYVKRIARSELGLILPGEIRYVDSGY